jgi:hypothetical protein
MAEARVSVIELVNNNNIFKYIFFVNLIVILLKLLKDLAQISLPAYGDYLLRRCR